MTASNVSQSSLPLSELKPGQRATIHGFDEGSPILMRFRELGILPGVELKVLRRAPMGDPLQIEVAGSLLSIRKAEAKHVRVELHSNGSA